MDLHGELVKVLDELAKINQIYLDVSLEERKIFLARVDELAARVQELTASLETGLQGMSDAADRP
jgi:hypothetical protein